MHLLSASSSRGRKALLTVAPWILWAVQQAHAQDQTRSAKPLVTQILGTSLKYDGKLTEDALRRAVQDISNKGFTLSWDASPATWSRDLLRRPKRLTHCRRVAELIHEHGMGVAFGFQWHSLLPREKTEALKSCPWAGEILDPATGTFTKKNWDFGSEDARREFIRRAKALFREVGEPFEMLYTDEVILGSPGPNAHYQRMSTYWTSPTYSREALSAFRGYLASKGHAGADTERFPVTTVAVPKSGKANAGLPAVPIIDTNRDRLVEDNHWPDSARWQHWYAWREDVYVAWLDGVTTAACETWGDRPQWLGCSYEAPWFWIVTGLGQNLDKIAALPHLDYLVAGYLSGARFERVKATAERAGKQWGIQVELCHYGKPKGIAPDVIRKRFRAAVEAGAATVTCYAGCNFRTDRANPSEGRRKTGLYHMPQQVDAWADCIRWLGERQGYLRELGQQ